MKTNYGDLLRAFADARLLVIGDLIVDVYHEGRPLGISVETPTLVVRHDQTRFSAGGAGLFVRNLLALGDRPTFVTLLGGDNYADQGRKLLAYPGLKKFIVHDQKRTTTVKERFWSNGHKLLAWDRLDNRPISAAVEKKILFFIKKNIKNFDRIIVSDYRHGLLTKTLAQKLVQLGKNYKKPVFVDSQVAHSEANHLWYRGADLFCLNLKEAKSIDPKFNETQIKKSLIRLQKILKTKNLILKMGEKGSISLIDHKIIRTPATKVRALDTTGAGDAFFAPIALSKSLTEKELKIANVWAALSTAIIGTEPPKKELLFKILKATKST